MLLKLSKQQCMIWIGELLAAKVLGQYVVPVPKPGGKSCIIFSELVEYGVCVVVAAWLMSACMLVIAMTCRCQRYTG